MYGLPLGVAVSSVGRRLGAHLIDGLIAVVTCGIGWLIWAFIIYGRGQTPAKQLMGMRVVNMTTGTRAGWGRMFVREHICKLLIGFFLGWLIVPYFWLVWDKNRQELWDKMVDTMVVDDPNGLVGSVPQSSTPYLEQPRQQYQLPPSPQQAPWDAPGGYGQPGGYVQPGDQGQQGSYPPYPPPPPPPPPPGPPQR
jgi:uncharacterized RDD family membrane protein YckC